MRRVEDTDAYAGGRRPDAKVLSEAGAATKIQAITRGKIVRKSIPVATDVAGFNDAV